MSDQQPPRTPPPPEPDESPQPVPAAEFDRLHDAMQAAVRRVRIDEAERIQVLLTLWDAVVRDEAARGLRTPSGGLAERAFGMHLTGLLGENRAQAIRQLHGALALRAGFPRVHAAFRAGEVGWRGAQDVVTYGGGLHGENRTAFDAEAARLATRMTAQELPKRLERLRDRLDPDAATDRAARAHRARAATARPGLLPGTGTLALTGPETDIAAMHDVLRRGAVAAHGADGEARTIRTLMYDLACDLILQGSAQPPVTGDSSNAPDTPGGPEASDARAAAGTSAAPEASGGPGAPAPPAAPADPFERLGDPRVPNRKAIHAEILVTVPADTVIGATDRPGRLAGWGSLPAAEIRRIVTAASHWTRVVVDPVDDAILRFDSEKRTIPPGLRRLIAARDETCTEPGGCPVPAHRTDLDHLVRVEHQGRTTVLNLTALCRPAHQTKDDGYLDVQRQPDGSVIWHTTRWGGRITVPPRIVVRLAPALSDDRDLPPIDLRAA